MENNPQDNERPGTSWAEAADDWAHHLRATVRPRTVESYELRLRQFRRYADHEGLSLAAVRGKHLARYLSLRGEAGVSAATRRLDATVVRSFFTWAAREAMIPANPLADYAIPKSPKPFVKCPSDAELSQLLSSIRERWKPRENPAARFLYSTARTFYARRNYAIILGLIRTAARAGELLGLRLDDLDLARRQMSFRQTKGGEPRHVPFSQDLADALQDYLRVRPRCDSPLVFITNTGDPVAVHAFGKQFMGYCAYAGVEGLSLHKLRHYALTFLAKQNPMMACAIAGHKNISTTMKYLHFDADDTREEYDRAQQESRILVNTRSQRARKKRLI